VNTRNGPPAVVFIASGGKRTPSSNRRASRPLARNVATAFASRARSGGSHALLA
jgi:hypothetical protein